MVEFDNPVSGAVFLRFAGPLIPVWLVGAVLVLLLDRFAVGGSPLSSSDLGLLLAVYSVLVAGLVSTLYYREWRRSPSRVLLSYDGMSGKFLGTPPRETRFDYGRILRIQRPGYFTARVEARSEGGQVVEWLNLTAENALRITEAWGAWRERDAGATGRPP
ncbi:MAG TPA: hypothetical protein VEY07_01990 [Thermoplasmata archaeon]|nr:hypothetical protein [Thermoplasmata archaeon]